MGSPYAKINLSTHAMGLVTVIGHFTMGARRYGAAGRLTPECDECAMSVFEFGAVKLPGCVYFGDSGEGRNQQCTECIRLGRECSFATAGMLNYSFGGDILPLD
jgi:hypothetical protein